jgi:putative addiction module component (TIGR02574 family)
MSIRDSILKEALTLKPSQKAELLDKLLSSLDKPDGAIDKLWAKEVEDRIDAYDRGEIKAFTLERVFKKNE